MIAFLLITIGLFLLIIVFGVAGAKHDMKYDEEVEEWEAEQRENERMEQERHQHFVKKTRDCIVNNQGYELNVLPFLTYLIGVSNNDDELCRLIGAIEKRAKQLQDYAKKANRISEDNNLGVALHIHIR